MPRPLCDSEYIYGLHDPGGEYIMLEEGVPGWVLVTEGIGSDPNNHNGRDYRYLSDKGLGVMVRINAGYGGVGTIPYERFYGDFAKRCANFVRNSFGAHIWIIGNEMNYPIEWPGADWDWNADPPRPKSLSTTGEPITPDRYVKCYKLVREAIRSLPGHENDQVITGAIAPWNALTTYPGNPNGDWIQYFRDMLEMLGPDQCDGIALHTYTHGPEVYKIDSEEKLGPPFSQYHYHFRAYVDFMNAIPRNMRQLPVYITETDQDTEWRNENTSWVRRAYGEIDWWNKNHPDQQIRSLILYRWPKLDKWYIEGKQGVIDDFRMALRYKYKWKPSIPTPEPDEPYRAILVAVLAPQKADTGSTIELRLSIRNDGTMTWPAGGDHPVRVGYHWYDRDGTAVPAADLRTALPRDVAPGEKLELDVRVGAPRVPGQFRLSLDMVHENITWFADRGSPTLDLDFEIVGEPLPQEQFFPQTQVWVRGVFLSFFNTYGLDICGWPITEEFVENGMRVQYFQRVALEEYAPGKVRLRLAAQHAWEARAKIAALERQVEALKRRLQTGWAPAPQPQITDVIQQLPRDAAAMVKRPESEIKHIVINHTAVRPGVEIRRIAQAHRRSWPAIVCQFYVEGDGTIYQTNPLDEVVSADQAWIYDSINIHVAGNFNKDIPTEAQLDSLAALCAWLLDTYNLDTTEVKGAKEFVTTASPGKQWLEGQRWKDMLYERIEALRGTGAPESPVASEEIQKQLEALERERDALLEQLTEAKARIEALQAKLDALEGTPLPETPGQIEQPPIKDVITELPRDPEKMFRRSTDEIRYIVINHTAVPPTVSVKRVAKAHRARWPAIVCQFYIEGDGTILQTNPLNEVVDGKQDWIRLGVNIHVAGNFTDDIPNEAQLNSLAALCAWLMHTYGIPEENVRGVQEFIVTGSPGKQWLHGQQWKYILLDRIRSLLAAVPTEESTDTDLVRRLQAQVARLQAENAQLQAELDDLKPDLAALRKQVNQLNDQVKALEEDKRKLADERQRLQVTVEEQQRTIAELQDRLRSGEGGPFVVPKPQMEYLVDKLPRHPTKTYESRSLEDITHITIHHSAAPANISAQTIANYHVNSKSHQWPGIGYHFYVKPDGSIDHTQDMGLISYHVYKNNEYTVGVCVAGNFTDVIPTPAQINATAHLVAWLMQELKVPIDNVMGHKQFPYNTTSCPGRQWLKDQKWHDLLKTRIQGVLEGKLGAAIKPLYHYVLFWQHGDAWAEEDWLGARNYVARFRPTSGFSVDDAMQAQNVT
ncbi:MAG: hypothetical protein D6791_00365, partial [Chloroflexi bacterium]